jgi:uncharacterized membrane protein YqjE
VSASETHRVAATALVAAGFIMLAAVAYGVTTRRTHRRTGLLAATLDELGHDLEQLSPRVR